MEESRFHKWYGDIEGFKGSAILKYLYWFKNMNIFKINQQNQMILCPLPKVLNALSDYKNVRNVINQVAPRVDCQYDFSQMEEDDMKALLRKVIRLIPQKDFQDFYDYFVNKPYIDYSRCWERVGDERYLSPRNTQNYKGMGIGSAMYLAAGLFMDELGMTLRGSSLQSNEATSVWERFLEQGLVEKIPHKGGGKQEVFSWKENLHLLMENPVMKP